MNNWLTIILTHEWIFEVLLSQGNVGNKVVQLIDLCSYAQIMHSLFGKNHSEAACGLAYSKLVVRRISSQVHSSWFISEESIQNLYSCNWWLHERMRAAQRTLHTHTPIHRAIESRQGLLWATNWIWTHCEYWALNAGLIRLVERDKITIEAYIRQIGICYKVFSSYSSIISTKVKCMQETSRVWVYLFYIHHKVFTSPASNVDAINPLLD